MGTFAGWSVVLFMWGGTIATIVYLIREELKWPKEGKKN
jgi:hypothetical protein